MMYTEVLGKIEPDILKALRLREGWNEADWDFVMGLNRTEKDIITFNLMVQEVLTICTNKFDYKLSSSTVYLSEPEDLHYILYFLQKPIIIEPELTTNDEFKDDIKQTSSDRDSDSDDDLETSEGDEDQDKDMMSSSSVQKTTSELKSTSSVHKTASKQKTVSSDHKTASVHKNIFKKKTTSAEQKTSSSEQKTSSSEQKTASSDSDDDKVKMITDSEERDVKTLYKKIDSKRRSKIKKADEEDTKFHMSLSDEPSSSELKKGEKEKDTDSKDKSDTSEEASKLVYSLWKKQVCKERGYNRFEGVGKTTIGQFGIIQKPLVQIEDSSTDNQSDLLSETNRDSSLQEQSTKENKSLKSRVSSSLSIKSIPDLARRISYGINNFFRSINKPGKQVSDCESASVPVPTEPSASTSKGVSSKPGTTPRRPYLLTSKNFDKDFREKRFDID